mmetsp:Transcript_180/g.346  ORF Transcript_180/g.346 Transcript_180/m.346 type:complete len:314 (-) Transcript_180:488-1429(-)
MRTHHHPGETQHGKIHPPQRPIVRRPRHRHVASADHASRHTGRAHDKLRAIVPDGHAGNHPGTGVPVAGGDDGRRAGRREGCRCVFGGDGRLRRQGPRRWQRRGGGGGGGRIFGRGRGGHDEITKFAPSRHRGRQQGGSRGEGGRRRGGRRRDDEGRWWPTQTQKRQHQRQQQRRVRQHPLPGRANHLQMARHAARRIRHTSRLRGRRPERSGRIGAPRDTHRERSERRRRILDSSTGPSRPGNVRPDRNRSARDRHQSGGAGDPPIGSAAVPSRLFHRSDRSILRVGIDSGDAVHEVGEGAAVLLRGEGGDV